MNYMTIGIIEPAQPTFQNMGCRKFFNQYTKCKKKKSNCKAILLRYHTCQTLCDQKVGDCDKYISILANLLKQS